MTKYNECPRCSHVPAGLSVSHMNVYRCGGCGEEFCHECHGSNGARKCPACGSHDRETAGKVSAEG